MCKRTDLNRVGKVAVCALLLFVASGQQGGCMLFQLLFPPSPPCSPGTVVWNVVTQGRTITLDGSRSVDPNGGTLRYFWTAFGGAPTPSSSGQAGVATFQAPANGTYTYELTVINEFDLTDTCSVTLSVTGYPAPPIPVNDPQTGSPNPVICRGASWTLSALPGAGGDAVEWFTGGCGGTPVAGGASPTVSPASTTTYFAWTRVSGTDIVSECVSVIVTVNPLPDTPTSRPADPDVICAGESATLSAGVGPGESVNWFTRSCGGTLAGSGNPLAVNPTATTTYFARAVNTTTGCLSTDCSSVTVRVIQPPTPPTSAAAEPNPVCAGGESGITLTATGGTGDTLAWYSGACGEELIDTGTPLDIPQPQETTTYFARWERAGCPPSACASVTVTVIPRPTPPDSVIVDRPVICASEPPPTITLTAAGGSGELLRWYVCPADSEFCNCGDNEIGTSSPLTTSAPAGSGPHTYFARWEAPDCEAFSACASVTVTVEQPFCGISGPPPPTVFAGDQNIAYSAPAGMAGYEWSIEVNGGTATIDGATDLPSIAVNTGPSQEQFTFTLTLTITDANACRSTCTRTITVQPPPPL